MRTLYLTSKADGEAANYAFVIQGAVTNPNFTTPSFTATASGPNMVGGSNSSGTTIYDAYIWRRKAHIDRLSQLTHAAFDASNSNAVALSLLIHMRFFAC